MSARRSRDRGAGRAHRGRRSLCMVLAGVLIFSACEQKRTSRHDEALPSAPGVANLEEPGGIEWLGRSFSTEGIFDLDPIDRDFLEEEGGEGGARPDPIQAVDKAAWFPLEESEGFLDLSPLGEKGSRRLFYAYRDFTRSEEGPLFLVVTTRGPTKLFIDGKPVYARYDAESRGGRTERVMIVLSRGRHSLLAKSDSEGTEPRLGLRLEPASSEVSPLASVEARPLARLIPGGGTLSGCLVSRVGSGLPAGGRIIARDPAGRMLCEGPTRADGSFSLELPASYSGPLSIALADSVSKARGRDEGRAADEIGRRIFAGDLAQALAMAASRARSALASLPPRSLDDFAGSASRPPSARPGSWDARASLSFLAELLEGKANPDLETLEAKLAALGEIDALVASLDRPLARGRVWRLAVASPYDGGLLPYSLRLPETYGGDFFLALHDRGESDLEAARRLEGLPFLAPYGGPDASWTGPWEELRDTILSSNRPTVSGRGFLVGWGSGASSALRLALLEPRRWRGVAAFGPLGRPEPGALSGDLSLLLAAGRGDAVAGADNLRLLASRLRAGGAAVEIADPPGSSPEEAWEEWSGRNPKGLADWAGRIVVSKMAPGAELWAPTLRNGVSPGLRLDDVLDPRGPSSASLAVDDDRHIRISTDNVSRLLLDPRALALAREGAILASANGHSLLLSAGEAVSIAFDEGGIPRPEEPAPSSPILRHLGGGIADLYRSPLAIVYGTRDGKRLPMLKEIAESLARLGAPGEGRVGIPEPLVVGDREATAAVLAERSLLLVGGPAENSLVAARAGLLPFEFGAEGKAVSKDDSGEGFCLVHPDPFDKTRLMGLVSLPYAKERALEIVAEILTPLRADPETTPIGRLWKTPDLLLFDKEGRPRLRASFDAFWEKLRPWN